MSARLTALTSGPPRPVSRPILAKLTTDACKADDIAVISWCMQAVALPESDATVEEVLEQALRRSAKWVALEVLSYILQQGADIHGLSAESTIDMESESVPSREVLEILIEHGWDINSCGHSSVHEPLLWLAIHDHEFVEWCLKRGANAHHSSVGPILERAAVGSNISTFELLRSKGANVTERECLLSVAGERMQQPAMLRCLLGQRQYKDASLASS